MSKVMRSMDLGVLWMSLLVFLHTGVTRVNAVDRPTVGVIRWDAWNLIDGQYDAISYYSHRAMRPEHFH